MNFDEESLFRNIFFGLVGGGWERVESGGKGGKGGCGVRSGEVLKL